MSLNSNNRNKDINKTSITDSSEEDIFENTSDKGWGKNFDLINKNKVEYIDENNSELCIHITDNFDPKKKKCIASINEQYYNQFITSIIHDDKPQLEKILNLPHLKHMK